MKMFLFLMLLPTLGLAKMQKPFSCQVTDLLNQGLDRDIAIDSNEKKIVLEVDHIDGLHYNNTVDNLRLICPNCHSQTDTYKNKNNGNGRKYR